MVGMVRTERTASRSQSGRSATELHPGRAGVARTRGLVLPEHALYLLSYNPLRRDGRTRTCDLAAPDRAPWPNWATPRTWTTGDSNSAPPVCRTGALPDELAAQVPGGWRLPADAHAVEFSTCRHVHPAGWCSQGA
jgi:hypothetical protein